MVLWLLFRPAAIRGMSLGVGMPLTCPSPTPGKPYLLSLNVLKLLVFLLFLWGEIRLFLLYVCLEGNYLVHIRFFSLFFSALIILNDVLVFFSVFSQEWY